MRVLVLVLAIVLLPLRGWLGDAMVLAPLQPGAAGLAAHAAIAHDMRDMHAAHTAADPAAMHPDAPASHDGHGTCDTCQFCHSVAMMAWPEMPMPAAAPGHAPACGPIVFASAQAAPGFKPPIS